MTVQSDDRRFEYAGNGVATAFTGPRLFDSGTTLLVYLVNDVTDVATLQVETTNYVITRVGLATSTVTMVAAPAVGTTLLLLRDVDFTQATRFVNQGAFFPELHEEAFDLSVMRDQQIKDLAELALRLPETVVGASGIISGALTALGPVILNSSKTGFEIGSTVGSGDLLLRANLAASPSGGNYGAKLVAVQRGTSARTLESVLLEQDITPEDYGAVGDGVTDDAAAINAALTAATLAPNRIVRFTKAVYAVGTTLVVPSGVRLEGRGAQFNAHNGYAASVGSTIKWIGALGGGSVVVHFNKHNYGGGGMSKLQVDSNNKADVGIWVDGCLGLRFEDVSSFSCVATADLKLSADITPVTQCAFNTFSGMYLGTATNGKCVLYLTGVSGADSFSNSFTNIRIDHGGNRHAIVLGNCDNNVFVGVLINRGTGGTGNGVRCDFTEMAGFPCSNEFHHLGSGVGGWWQNDTPAAPNLVFSYMLDNGEPYPVLNGSSGLLYNTSYGLITSELPGTVGGAGQPAFQNSWVAFGGAEQAPRYWKDRLGFVHVEGSIKSGTGLNTIVFTLPTNYRPTATLTFPTNSNGAFGSINVDSSGNVRAIVGSTTHFSLTGIYFRNDYVQL